MTSVAKYNGEGLGHSVISISIIKMVYIAVAQTAIASAPAKLYWPLYMIALVPI